MFSRASSLTALSRSCRYLLRPQVPTRAFSLTARSHAAINAAMADTSGITADSLKNKLTETLQAVHVEVEDLSGTTLKYDPYDVEAVSFFPGSINLTDALLFV